MPTATFDWDKFFAESAADLERLRQIENFDRKKFLAESEADLERLRKIENGFKPETFNWQDLQKFLDNFENDFVIVKRSCITEPTWGKVHNK